MAARHVVIGVGNAYRGDDAVGLVVADRLAKRVTAGVAVLVVADAASRLLDAWAGADTALVVDAATAGAPPGTIHRFDASERAVPERLLGCSTHAVGVGETIELARVLGTLPRRIVVYGIEGGDFTAGSALSRLVADAVVPAVNAVAGELDRLTSSDR